MRTRTRLVVLAAVVASALPLLAGCAGASDAPASTTTAPSPTVTPTPTTTPTPTPDAPVVAGGAKPPLVAGGDCSRLTSPAELATATGLPIVELTLRDTQDEQNLGGIACDFLGTAEGGRITVLPLDALAEAGVEPADFPPVPDSCINACEWRWQDDAVLVIGYLYPNDYGVAEAAAVGEQLGPRIAAATTAAAGPNWRRDVSAWWPARDCADVAARVAELTGTPFTGTPGSFYGGGDPGSATAIAWLAERHTECRLDDGGPPVAVAFTSGMAWTVPSPYAGDVQPYDTGVAGIAGYLETPAGSIDPVAAYELTDGVNRTTVGFASTRDDAAAIVDALSAVSAD